MGKISSKNEGKVGSHRGYWFIYTSPLSGVITLLITGSGPPNTKICKNNVLVMMIA